MELQLKHLSVYLPYGLQMTYKNFTGTLISINENGLFKVTCSDWYQDVKQCRYLPILKPLCSLKASNVDMSDISFELFLRKVKSGEAKYCNVNKLIEQHFDVFELIDAGLAIKKLDYSKPTMPEPKFTNEEYLGLLGAPDKDKEPKPRIWDYNHPF